MSEAYLLTLVWLLPVLTSLLTLPISRENHLRIKQINALGSGLNLALVIYLTIRFISVSQASPPAAGDRVTNLYFTTELPWFEMLNIRYLIGVDALSMLMLLLTSIIIFAGVFASWELKTQAKEFFVLLNVLVSGVFGVFVSFDLFLLFLFYEVAVLPMYMLIGVWGTGKKEYSAMKLTLMLVAGSALIFGGILGLYFQSGLQTFGLDELASVDYPMHFQMWAFPALFVGFAVLSAMFPFHTWSPDGHASAPTAVSMLHAGVLMKLGGYGCLRVAMYILPEGSREWMPFFMVLITINIAIGAFIAIRQKDLKYITAYSSVSHLGLVLLGLGVMTFVGIKGSSMQMISHGLLTGLFFCLIGMIYGRTHTRMVDEMGGLMKVIPFLSVAFVLAGLTGLGLPGLSGFVAEATIFVGAFQNPSPLVRVCTVIAVLSIVTTAVYIIRSANQMLTGPLNPKFASLPPTKWHEMLPVMILLFCIVAMGVMPGWMERLLDQGLQPIFNNLTR